MVKSERESGFDVWVCLSKVLKCLGGGGEVHLIIETSQWYIYTPNMKSTHKHTIWGNMVSEMLQLRCTLWGEVSSLGTNQLSHQW
jgi:hypothetical protein